MGKVKSRDAGASVGVCLPPGAGGWRSMCRDPMDTPNTLSLLLPLLQVLLWSSSVSLWLHPIPAPWSSFSPSLHPCSLVLTPSIPSLLHELMVPLHKYHIGGENSQPVDPNPRFPCHHFPWWPRHSRDELGLLGCNTGLLGCGTGNAGIKYWVCWDVVLGVLDAVLDC